MRCTKRLLIAIAASVTASVSLADTEQKTSNTQKTEQTSEAYKRVASSKTLGMSEEEYERFKAIMQGVRGIWSPNIDPLLALGVNAESAEERRRYAERYVVQEFERTERELAFERATQAAWKRLYPNRQRLESVASLRRQTGAGAVSEITTRAAVIVKAECGSCRADIQRYLTIVKSQQHSITAVDFYLIDSNGDDRVLRDWVEGESVPMGLLEQGVVTVNHGHDHTNIKKLPTVYERMASGQWIEKASH